MPREMSLLPNECDDSPDAIIPLTMENVLTAYSVGMLNEALKMYLKEFSHHDIWVKGEILGYKEGNHAYFRLCDKEDGSDEVKAEISVSVWNTFLKQIKSKLSLTDTSLHLKDGMFVQLKCSVDFWPKAGKLQLIAHDIDPTVTIGELHLTRIKIFNELKEMGLHEKNKKLEMPPCPLKIALISSRGAAGYHDFLSEIEQSGYGFKIDFCHSSVQGRDTEDDIVSAFKKISKAGKYDAVVLIRGGGSVTDLKWFDNKNICLAIANCPFPVLTGIGHEIDLSAADMVANQSFKTPTAVAVFLADRISDSGSLLKELIRDLHASAVGLIAGTESSLLDTIGDITERTKQFILGQERDLHDICKDIVSNSKMQLEKEKVSFDILKGNVKVGLVSLIKHQEQSLAHFQEKAAILDPANTLKLGYSITRDKAGKVLKSVDQVSIGDEVATSLSDGMIVSNTVRKEKKQ